MGIPLKIAGLQQICSSAIFNIPDLKSYVDICRMAFHGFLKLFQVERFLIMYFTALICGFFIELLLPGFKLNIIISFIYSQNKSQSVT